MNKRHYEHTLPNIRGSLSNTYYCLGIQNKGRRGPDGMKPPVTYSHPKPVIAMIHMPFRSDGSSYAEVTSEARACSGVEERAEFSILVHRSF